MPPRKQQRQVQQHAAEPSASTAAGMQPGPSSAPAAAAFPLLSLPHAVLAQHVWPLLSPWGRAQLHATCKELRQLSDGLLEGTMQFDVTAYLSKTVRTRAESRAERQRGCASQQGLGCVEQWDGKCALLARCPHIQSLTLRMETILPPDKLQQLCTAAGGRIKHLKLVMPRLTARILHNTLAMGPSLCPALRELHIYMQLGLQSQVANVPVLLGLPATLESLSLRVEQTGETSGFWPALAGALGAATQLTQLHSLKLDLRYLRPQDVDVSPLLPIASRLTHLFVLWLTRHGGAAGLPQLLAACSTSLTSLALPAAVPAATDHPSLAQVLAAAPNLQQLEVLPARGGSSPTAADVHALRTHANLRRLVIHSQELCSALAAAALPPGSLQHMGIELPGDSCFTSGELLIGLGALSGQFRLVHESASMPCLSLGRPPLDADLLNRLGQALTQPGVEIVRKVGAEDPVSGAVVPTVPVVCNMSVAGPLHQASDQQAVARLLSRFTGLSMCSDRGTSSTFCNEAEAVQAGSSAGLWLLPAVAHISTLTVCCYDHALLQHAAALSSVLSHDYLPQLQCLVFGSHPRSDWPDPFKADTSLSSKVLPSEDELVGLAQVLKACSGRPRLQVIPAQRLSVAAIDRVRAALKANPAQGQQAGVALDDDGRSLLLQHVLC